MKFEKHTIQWTSEKAARFWDDISDNQAIRAKFFGSQAGPQLAARINRIVKFKNLLNILDLSCGRGDVLLACLKYQRPGQSYFGTDFSPKNVNTVNKKLAGQPGFKGAFELQHYPSSFEENRFDLVILTEVIEHLDQQELDAMLNETRRLLKPGGWICITTPYNEELAANQVMCPDCGCLFHRWQHVRSWNLHQLRDTMGQYGYLPRLIKKVAWSGQLKNGRLLDLSLKFRLIRPTGLLYLGTQGNQKVR